MAFKTRLLTTAAIPLIALMGMGPAFAVELPRPGTPVVAQSPVIKVQADDDELLKQQRQERRENRRNKNNAAAEDGQDDNGGQRRNRQKAAEAEQQEAAPEQQPRRKKQQADTSATQADEQLNDAVDQNNRKRRNQQAQQTDDAAQSGQADEDSTQPKRRDRKNQQAQQPVEDNASQAEEDSTQQKRRDRKKQAAQQENAPAAENGNDNAEQQADQSDEQLRKAVQDNNDKRRKKNNQAEQSADDATTADDNGNQNNRRNKKNQDAATSTDGENDDAGANRRNQRPVDVKKAKDVAADPSKTTDTVVLPVENGAAVLDSDKDADRAGVDRDRRKRQRDEARPAKVPTSDRDAQAGFRDEKKIVIKPVLETRGEEIRGFKGYDDVGGRRVGDRRDRVVIDVGGRLVIRTNDDRRLASNQKIRYEQLPNGQVREVIVRPDGDRVVTVRNRYGEIVRRSRIDRSDREVVLFYSPVLERGRDRLFLRDAGADLPPMRLTVPVRDYIIDVSGGGGNRNFEEFLDEPPVEQVERVYSVDEVKNSARIRDKMRRIDLDTITFDTGSTEISENQVQSLKRVGQAIKNILDEDPGETFLIEGHTDAVGSDESNLVLSDGRAESVAEVLSDAFGIDAENLVTQGYGERFLKIDTESAARENRRVTIRRITPLVRPLEAAQQ